MPIDVDFFFNFLGYLHLVFLLACRNGDVHAGSITEIWEARRVTVDLFIYVFSIFWYRGINLVRNCA